MATVKLSPVFNDQIVDQNGAPANGWLINTYAAGSSTLAVTYTDSAGSVAQSNPVVINALGYPQNGQIWLVAGQTYKLVLTDSLGVVKKTMDGISGVNDTGATTDEWADTGTAPIYISPNSYSVAGDQTAQFQVGRRQKLLVTAGTVYGRILTSAYTALTTITMQMDGTQALDSGLSSVQNSILRANVLSLPERIATTAGVVNAYTASVGVARLVIGDEYKIKFAIANDGALAPTLNLDATGVLPIILQSGAVPGGGALNGEHKIRATAAGFIVLNPNPVAVSQKIQPLMQPVIANGALTVGINPTSLDFRSTILTSPTVNTRAINAAISLTLPSGSALGANNAISSRFVLLGIDNAGIVEPAVVNLAGGNNLDETTLINTTAISSIPFFTGSMTTTVLTVTAVASGTLAVGQYINGTGITANTVIVSLGTGSGGTGTYNINNSQSVGSEAMSASAPNVIYSTTARTGVPFKVVGFYDENNPVAGVHSVLPTTVQGQGGNAMATMGSLGYGQTSQTVTRVLATTYYNTTGRPIWLSVTYVQNAGSTIITVNGNIAAQSGGASGNCSVGAPIPVGAYYTITQNAGNTIANTYELR